MTIECKAEGIMGDSCRKARLKSPNYCAWAEEVAIDHNPQDLAVEKGARGCVNHDILVVVVNSRKK